MVDKTLACRDCGKSFIFTASEQAFYASKGFTNEPSRCPDCRAARKRSDTGGGFRSYGSSDLAGERRMFSVVCAQCGKDTQVPFEPRGDRPVYCSECFQARRPTDNRSWARR